MRYALMLAALVVVAPLSAAEKLTPKEIADGWLQLFDGETTFGWTMPDGDKWTIANGLLSPQAGNKGALLTTTEFSAFELVIEYQAKADGPGKVVLHSDTVQFVGKSAVSSYDLPLVRIGVGWHQLKLKVRGGTIVQVSFESLGVVKTGAGGGTCPWLMRIGLIGNGFVIRDIRLKPLFLTSIFNGKDLSGWKVFKGEPAREKSKFSVTKEGWLNIKDGPGDLQTEGAYGDFILQLECISNGKHLNSGVFFRCRPGEYQQGYEAQIRNQFTPDTPQEYVVEIYDSKTNELKEKQKLKSPAFDYGTGAIYRRMPARREASKDGEWFTMTVIAHGRHLATWVNGLQVADWTDHRPLKDNARAGCRLEKGPISLQGHDPTTDLSFRNFRIAELPEIKR